MAHPNNAYGIRPKIVHGIRPTHRYDIDGLTITSISSEVLVNGPTLE
jgi:hypothetical protein